MKHKGLFIALSFCSFISYGENNHEQLQQEVQRLQQKTDRLQAQLKRLQQQATTKLPAKNSDKSNSQTKPKNSTNTLDFHRSAVTVHTPDSHPESLEFYPTALIADEQVLTYIAGTPIVASPYLGSRPAFDGSDYIVNISSINRDIRLMQQRRRLDKAYQQLGYPIPQVPIIALSGKVEPAGSWHRSYFGRTNGDWTLGGTELDVAAILNETVEGYVSIAYDDALPLMGGQRIANSAMFLNMGIINIGNLEKTPLYFTAGQMLVPFGRYASSMVSAPLTMRIGRTRARPIVLGYKSQYETGPFAALYGFRSDTILGDAAAGGINMGYIYSKGDITAEVGASGISSINDASGMQVTDSNTTATFGGFASITSGSEAVKKVPGLDVHGSISIDRYNFTAEWVSASHAFRTQDLSFNGKGAKPQGLQLEAGTTFMAFERPASFAIGYQWSKEALALNLPKRRISGVFNISIWKDTVESIEYRHDIDYGRQQFANGAAPTGTVNASTIGTGRSSDTVSAQIGVYF